MFFSGDKLKNNRRISTGAGSRFLFLLDLLAVAQTILTLLLVLGIFQLFFTVKESVVAVTPDFPGQLPQETLQELAKNGNADLGGIKLELAQTDERGDVIKVAGDNFVISGGGKQQSVLGAPVSDDYGNKAAAVDASDLGFFEDGQTADISRGDGFIFKFKKGGAVRNEIWAHGEKIIAGESWTLQYYSQDASGWVDLGECKKTKIDRGDENMQAKRQCDDAGGTEFDIVYDFAQGRDPKITFNANFAEAGRYRLVWELDGAGDAVIKNDAGSNAVVFTDAAGGEMFFDYNDVFGQFGDITQVDIEQKKARLTFDIGTIPAGKFVLDPTFGYTDIGSTTAGVMGMIRGSVFTAIENGTASSITVYLANSGASKNVKAAIYKSSDMKLLASTEQRSIPAATGWQTFNFADPKPNLVAGTGYLLAVWSSLGSGNNLVYYNAINSPKSGYYKMLAYGNWPGTLVQPSSNKFKHSIYCSYEKSVVSVSVSGGQIGYGAMPLGSSEDTTISGIDNTQIVSNDGTAVENFNIRGIDSGCPWALAAAAGDEKYVHEFCANGSGPPDICDVSPNWKALSANYQALAGPVASGQASRFDTRITVPMNTVCFSQQNVDVVIQAVEP